ncbi:MAG: hypothetical protein KC468_34940 [Myxococcales bacterium]|nr:hypothetical protein [Myxococcales bacterium]
MEQPGASSSVVEVGVEAEVEVEDEVVEDEVVSDVEVRSEVDVVIDDGVIFAFGGLVGSRVSSWVDGAVMHSALTHARLASQIPP